MSIVVFSTYNGVPIPLGSSVVCDATTLAARVFDPLLDSEDDIVGVTYPKSGTNGRLASSADGLCFSDKDYFKYTELLQYEIGLDNQLILNPNYDPILDTVNSDTYVYVVILGLAAVAVNQVVPSIWKRIRTGVNYHVYIIR